VASGQIDAAYAQFVASGGFGEAVEIVDADELHATLRRLGQVQIETVRAHRLISKRWKLR
jgi:hypothetical protein